MATRKALLASITLFLLLGSCAADKSSQQKNVLLVYIDDGGFEMGAYGNKAVKTPNIDSFSKRAVVFKHGFTSVSSCSPSRSALLTGAQSYMYLKFNQFIILL